MSIQLCNPTLSPIVSDEVGEYMYSLCGYIPLYVLDVINDYYETDFEKNVSTLSRLYKEATYLITEQNIGIALKKEYENTYHGCDKYIDNLQYIVNHQYKNKLTMMKAFRSLEHYFDKFLVDIICDLQAWIQHGSI